MLTQEDKNKNFSIFLKKLSELGIDTAVFQDDEEKIKNAPYETQNYKNMAYDGSMLNVVLREITPMALKLNELLPSEVKVDRNSLIKVCLLHQMGKIDMFKPVTDAWKIERYKQLYEFAPQKSILKCGQKSYFYCIKKNIDFTEEEVEAMTILDRDCEDKQAYFFASPLSVIIKQANELVELKNRVIYKNGATTD